MRTIKTYRKVGAFYIACEEDLSTPIQLSAGINLDYLSCRPTRKLDHSV
jgi:hypothetical protein